jgi:hypothetical protein
MIALILEIIIASFIAAAIWQSGHPIIAVIAWFAVMSLSNSAYRKN